MDKPKLFKKDITPIVWIATIILFGVIFLAGAELLQPQKTDQLTSAPGKAVNFKIVEYMHNQVIRVCYCWRFRETIDYIQPYQEGDSDDFPSIEKIWRGYGQAIEISVVKKWEQNE